MSSSLTTSRNRNGKGAFAFLTKIGFSDFESCALYRMAILQPFRAFRAKNSHAPAGQALIQAKQQIKKFCDHPATSAAFAPGVNPLLP